jgi:hypothetical protein
VCLQVVSFSKNPDHATIKERTTTRTSSGYSRRTRIGYGASFSANSDIFVFLSTLPSSKLYHRNGKILIRLKQEDFVFEKDS